MRNKTLVFTATYNEAENIDKFLNLALKIKDIDILIIDDNSPDQTSEVIKKFQLSYKNLFLINRHAKLGLDTAHKKSFEYANQNNYQKLITLDADLSHDPNQIREFIRQLDQYPFVIGSRYTKGGKNKMKISRYILSYVGNKIIKLVLNIPCEEFTTSFRGFNLKKLKNFQIDKVKSQGYSFFMETVYWVNKTQNEIKQIPIIFEDRNKGVSKISKIESLRTLKNLFLLKTNFIKKNDE
jgi:dolichol-phosphate mannosyltransferase